ncbi:uncharacterized protein LOC126900243 isoform X1 [Daktulosphaira vitifoliae]|uniref:uncharacterized protein LOC126900243 isoform X1 n=1 Tax=Daktulosphaira vitifoliae TaxID=58002 RepID=UPI0021AA31A1|nr:uncharacterized protein LOC126900243 isoform X1 [Daktulosphaira vitifoliae]
MMEIISFQTIYLIYLILILYCAIAKPLGSDDEKESEELKILIKSAKNSCTDASGEWTKNIESLLDTDLKNFYNEIKKHHSSVSVNNANSFIRNVKKNIAIEQTSDSLKTFNDFNEFKNYIREKLSLNRKEYFILLSSKCQINVCLYLQHWIKCRGKKSKLKHMKKMMSMLGVVMCAKVSMLGPLAVFMIGAKALKALILSVMALTISKIILLKKLKSGGHSGSTQVEWVSEKDDQNAHLLAYANQAKISVVTSQPAIASVYQHQVQPLYPSREIQPGYH